MPSFSSSLLATSAAPQSIIAEVEHYLHGVADQKLNLERLARRFGLDKYELIRHFKRQLGVTPNRYLTMLRIEQAAGCWRRATR